MAAGVVIKPKSANINAAINNTKYAYQSVRRIMDALIAAKNSGGGNNWTAVATALGEANATDGQAVFENLDLALGYLTNVNDALSPTDGGAL